MTLWNVEFSLALHNRTGKYQIGRAILADHADLIARTYYWRLAAADIPSGLRARVIGKLLQTEIRLRADPRLAAPARIRTGRPVLHLDPFTVTIHALTPDDMVLCHDMGPITHPGLFTPQVVSLYRRAFATIADIGPRTIFVSEASRRAYRDVYGPLRRSDIIYPPIRFPSGGPAGDPPDPPRGVGRPFLLTVGSIGARKNQAATIRAYAASGLAGRGVGYVLCGSREPGCEDVAKAAAATPGVVLLDHVSDEVLAWLYDNAAGFVLVSRLEGFGMPVAEAIARDLVPLISAGGVLEEVAGPAALTADPGDEAGIARQMSALAAMTAAEKARRRSDLSQAITRFTPERFRDAWRRVLC
ncbi:group 1 glycosyl transferase [Oceaniovalibus guishaninsula JLT2003]|uniref:Group 1 glycosyl transferase n=1 Tax=Oceaniovalibus guishaninsula JLT2003 TaxID=1231392 RepID=K2HJI9_9RHOB|nr:glycosyltransferase [Oceaniovalibus guishaninsula]EKE43134.1 group 1 glycosyl transferase [Oceaniovalibus guishaninsula JLT2003]